MIVSALQVIAVLGTFLTGAYSLLRPRSVTGFTGLQPVGGRGITEIRSVLGGFFVGLAGAAFFLDRAVTYPMLGITYLVVAGVRTISMVLDRSRESSNYISIAVEVFFGVVLLL